MFLRKENLFFEEELGQMKLGQIFRWNSRHSKTQNKIDVSSFVEDPLNIDIPNISSTEEKSTRGKEWNSIRQNF